ncbi:MAG: serine--tRNA ligase, partial [Deltaproteobacteria bacterium]
MLDIRYLRDNLEEAARALATRGDEVDLSLVTTLDGRRRELLAEVEGLKAERNRVSALIGRMKDKSQVQGEIARMKEVSARIKELDEQVRQVDDELRAFLLTLPNIPHPQTPVGACEDDNVEVRRWGTPRQFDFDIADHVDIGERLGILDLERAGKLSGARFALLKGAGARLERALINFMLDLHTGEHNYIETLPPFMVNRATMTGTGQLPKFEDDLFHTEGVDLFLIPTAEVPVTNIHRDEILDGDDLPLCFTAYT